MTTHLETCLTSGQAAQRLRDARLELDRTPDDEPTRILDATIDDLTPRSATGDADARAKLMAAIHERDHMRKRNNERQASRAVLSSQIEHYTAEENRLAHEERIHAANSATNDLLQAVTEFKLAAAEVCRRYDRILSIQRRNQHVAGAQTALPPRLGFHFEMMLPEMWQGTVSNMIQQGSLVWLNDEKKREQQLREAA